MRSARGIPEDVVINNLKFMELIYGFFEESAQSDSSKRKISSADYQSITLLAIGGFSLLAVEIDLPKIVFSKKLTCHCCI